jgi:bacillithiol biosynthesis deacetylase BshB1
MEGNVFKLDLLAFGAHPDDVELSCAGTIMRAVVDGKRVGVADLTRGELGTRGTAETRDEEAEQASRLMGIKVRANLGLADGFFRPDQESIKDVITVIRSFQPDILIAPALYDRHPDHGRGAQLIAESAFLSGLAKIETWDDEDKPQSPWRPRMVYHYIQDRWMEPDFAVDISDYIDRKMDVILAFKTQFYDPKSDEPQTYIAQPEFLENIKARAAEFGRPCGYRYAEGFKSARWPGVKDIFQLD